MVLKSNDCVDYSGVTGEGLSGLTFGLGNFVAVTAGGWSPHVYIPNGSIVITPKIGRPVLLEKVSTNSFNAVKFVPNIFIGAGDKGTIFTSHDSWTWQQQASGTTQALYAIAHGKGTNVVVGAAGMILISTDGKKWISSNAGTNDFRAIAFGQERFVLVTANSFFASSNLADWVQSDMGTNFTTGPIAFGNGKFLALNWDGRYFHSTDGVTWRAWSLPSAVYGVDVVFGEGAFVAIGFDPWTNQSVILTSTNALDWSEKYRTTGLRVLAFGNNRFLAMGSHGKVVRSFADLLFEFSGRQMDGILQFDLIGLPSPKASIQQSRDLVHWESFGKVTGQDGRARFSFRPTNDVPARFYRALAE